MNTLLLFSVSLYVVLLVVMAEALQAQQRQLIEITNPLKAVPESLPSAICADWPTWVLRQEDGKETWTKIAHNDKGFVAPTSLDELWQPLDLKLPECRLAVGLHVRDGTIRHVLPAVDLSYNHRHRNRGLCSVPRAHQWMDFNAYMATGGESSYRMVLQVRELTRRLEDDNNDDHYWETLMELDSVQECVTAAISALAREPPVELGDGSFIVHAIGKSSGQEGEFKPCPGIGNELRVLLLLLEGDDVQPVGALGVQVKKTAAGSESDYLPDAYKPLFEDESLRRPAYTESKRRMEQLHEKSSSGSKETVDGEL